MNVSQILPSQMPTSLRGLFALLIATVVMHLGAATVADDNKGSETRSTSDSKFQRALDTGEFVVAKQSLPDSGGSANVDAALADVATRQMMAGEADGALATLRAIDSPSHREAVLRGGQAAIRRGLAVPSAPDSIAGSGSGRGPIVGNGGGGGFADFGSLMNLIQTTVAPDTWEALGGNSTMAPYPQGVFVDPDGLLVESPQTEDSLPSLSDLSHGLGIDSAADSTDWRSAADMRCVSLRRVRDEIAARRFAGQSLGDDLLNLAGLSEIRYVILAEDDIVLAGPVGGIVQDRGWWSERSSGQTTLRLDFLARSFACVLADLPFGCTIDPTPEGMQRAAEVAGKIRSGDVPIGLAAEELRTALGKQNVEVFGAAADTSVALLMIEADRLMKQLALGERAMPEGVGDYLASINTFIKQGPPNGLLLRLWFAPRPLAVTSDHRKQVFQLEGRPIRLSGQNQRALADGGRGAVTVDPRSEDFVQRFNRHWTSVRDAFPLLGSLESLYQTAAVAELINRHAKDATHEKLVAALAAEEDVQHWSMIAPTKVDSIAVMHTIRHGKQRHHVLLASGGVSVDPSQTVSENEELYPSLEHQESLVSLAPKAVNRWWWNARE